MYNDEYKGIIANEAVFVSIYFMFSLYLNLYTL
jgi:hypothetical protein